MRIFVLTGLILLFSITANAQIYKWIDENGNTQYTDRPPPPGAAREGQRLNIRALATSANSETSKSKSLIEERLEFDKRRDKKKAEDVKQQAKTEEDKKKCIDAQARLRMYTDTPRMTVPDGTGGITYVDDETRQKRIEEANKAIKALCK